MTDVIAPGRKIDQPCLTPTITGPIAGCGQVRRRQCFSKFQIVRFDRLDCRLLSISAVV